VTRTAGSARIGNAIADLIDQGARLSKEVLDALLSDTVEVARQLTAGGTTLSATTGRLLGGCDCCDIPPPCWMPQQLGTITSHVCPGATASLRLRITNGSAVQREITVTAAGPQAAMVAIEPGSVTLAPFGEGTVTATLAAAADQRCEPQHVQLWVHGCRDHVLRWTVEVSERGCSCSHEIEIEDCPDLVHHWYDHFYCERPCPGSTVASHG